MFETQPLVNAFARLICRAYPLPVARVRLLQWALKRVRGFAIARDAFGGIFLLNLANYIDARLYLEGAYESETIGRFLQAAGKSGAEVFIDVGANIGVVTVAVARKLKPQEIHCFEPDLRNYAQLQSNVYLNGLYAQCRLHRLALSDREGEATLFIAKESSDLDQGKHNAGTNSLERNDQRHGGASSTVQVKVADKMFTWKGRKAAVKIDVEGHELSVLKGMMMLLRDNDCVLLIEAIGEKQKAAQALLSEAGYKQVAALPDDNFIFVRKENR